MSSEAWLQKFKEADAIWEFPGTGPHASYELADQHTNFYFNSDIAVRNALLVTSICEAFLQRCQARELKPDWVVTYTAAVSAMIVPAARLAGMLSARFGTIDLRDQACHFQPAPHETILFIGDDIISGTVVAQMAALIARSGARILPFFLVLANFHGAPSYKDMEIIALFTHKIATYPPNACPLCENGSRAVKARRMWGILKQQGHK